jgi:hypothetical protein
LNGDHLDGPKCFQIAQFAQNGDWEALGIVFWTIGDPSGEDSCERCLDTCIPKDVHHMFLKERITAQRVTGQDGVGGLQALLQSGNIDLTLHLEKCIQKFWIHIAGKLNYQ